MGTDLVPLLPADHAEEPDVAAMLRAWDRASIRSRILKTGIAFATAGAIVFAVLSAGNPLALFARARASLMSTSLVSTSLMGTSLVGTSTSQDGAGQQQEIASTDGQLLPPTARDAPKRDDKNTETISPRDAADQSQANVRQQPADDLLRQFQTWAADKDARAEADPVQPLEPSHSAESARPVEPVPPAQELQTQVAQEAGPQVRHVRRHRLIVPMQNARAEIRPEQNARPTARLAKTARTDLRRAAPIRASQPPQDP
jgi:hypothetical protein